MLRVQSGVAIEPDYNSSSRDVASLVEYATAEISRGGRNVGCQLSGSITVNRLLGNFHIKASSEAGSRVDPAAANLG